MNANEDSTDAQEQMLVAEAVRDSAAALEKVLVAVAALDEEAVRAPSPLPDWTRGHVLAHIEGVGNAHARQAEFAARGERIQAYDGGMSGRNARIEEGAGRTVAEHQVALQALAARLADAWPADGDPRWQGRVTYRDGTVSDVALAWWREVRIHLVDLGVGIGPASWSEALCVHLLDFLTPRLPAEEAIELVADDGEVRRAVGPDGEAVLQVGGALRELVAWLAGREPQERPRATASGAPVELPTLRPWPSAERR